MTWVEMLPLISGLKDDTPLGLIVSIRAEKDREKLKHFNKSQKKIQSDWRAKVDKRVISQMTDEEKKKAVSEIQNIFKQKFS